MEEDVPIESKLITKRIAAAQKAVEGQNFSARKHLLEYDDVMNKQRTAVYGMRRNLLEGADQKERITTIIDGIVGTFMEMRCPPGTPGDTWDLATLESDVLTQFGVKIHQAQLLGQTRDAIEQQILELVLRRYQEKESLVGAGIMRETERMVMLHVIDAQWKDHMLSMDHLKEGIGLRAYGQKDPLVEYKRESFQIFQDMMDRIEDETIKILFFLQAEDASGRVYSGHEDDEEDFAAPVGVPAEPPSNLDSGRAAAQAVMSDFTQRVHKQKEREMAQMQVGAPAAGTGPQTVIKGDKVGRNDPCPCGSGKKYKKCHGS
jgi:preprotein translocase subunit SecA